MRLNEYYRGILKKAVREAVEEEYKKSSFGKEFAYETARVFGIMKDVRDILYPSCDMDVLHKYKFTEIISSFRFRKDAKSGRYFIESPYKTSPGDYESKVGVLIPKDNESKVFDKFLQMVPTRELDYFFDISDRYKCEVMNIQGAYENVLKNSSTVKSLLKKAPIFDNFLHLIYKDSSPIAALEVPVDESLHTIQIFEQSIKE